MDMEHPYRSAAFKLHDPGVFYQLRLRRTATVRLFTLVKLGSKALEVIQEGVTLPMVYYHSDKTQPPEHHPTRIESIRDGGPIGFKDHVMVILDIEKEDKIKE